MKRMPVLLIAVCTAGCGQAETTPQPEDQPEAAVPPRAEGQIGDAQFPEGTVQLVVAEEDMPWGPCPPTLPAGCEIAVLEGSPQAPDLFTVRFRVDGDFVMPPHTHPKDERVTVLSGKMAVAFGADATREDAAEFGPGDYYVNARGAVHVVWADETSVIQITGIGPWEARFVDDAGS